MSELQEIIHRTTHIAFQSGQITERTRILSLIQEAKDETVNHYSTPAYIVLRELEKEIKAIPNG
jgi:hypothetical protein